MLGSPTATRRPAAPGTGPRRRGAQLRWMNSCSQRRSQGATAKPKRDQVPTSHRSSTTAHVVLTGSRWAHFAANARPFRSESGGSFTSGWLGSRGRRRLLRPRRLGLDPEDFDVVFAYPWPDEECLTSALFECYARDGAVLLADHDLGGCACAVVGRCYVPRSNLPTPTSAARPPPGTGPRRYGGRDRGGLTASLAVALAVR
jgi:hypothetical protein